MQVLQLNTLQLFRIREKLRMEEHKYISLLNNVREANGFLSLDEIIDLVAVDNIVYDCFSLLISKKVKIGKNNVFYPNVIISCGNDSELTIGNSNYFFSSTHFVAENEGKILIGNSNEFSDGGVCVKANMPGACTVFGNNGRYDGRINIFGKCIFETGSQIIGNINVYNCCLKEGGDYTEKNPDQRAGLLKGFGTVKGAIVNKGMVINGAGDFSKFPMELQSNYHK